jgi:hypothetical protein
LFSCLFLYYFCCNQFPERGPSPFGHGSNKIPLKLASLLKPKINTEQAISPSPEIVEPSIAEGRTTLSAAAPNLASLLKPKLSEQSPSSPTSPNMLMKRKSVDWSSQAISKCPEKQESSPNSKFNGALLKNKNTEGSRSKSPTPPNIHHPMKSKGDSHSTSNNTAKMAAQRSPSPSRMKPALGGAACLGQFLELKMRGGIQCCLSPAYLMLDLPCFVLHHLFCLKHLRILILLVIVSIKRPVHLLKEFFYPALSLRNASGSTQMPVLA